MSSEPITVAKSFDMELVNTAASSLVYLLSNLDMKQMMEHKTLTTSYNLEPTKAVYDEIMKGFEGLKNPLLDGNMHEFCGTLFVVLQNVFQASSAGVEKSRMAAGEPPYTDDEMNTFFSQWFTQILNLLYNIQRGEISSYSMGGERKP